MKNIYNVFMVILLISIFILNFEQPVQVNIFDKKDNLDEDFVMVNTTANKGMILKKHFTYETDNNVGNENIENWTDYYINKWYDELYINDKQYLYLKNLPEIQISENQLEIDNVYHQNILTNYYLLNIIRLEHYLELSKMGIDFTTLDIPNVYLDISRNNYVNTGGTYYVKGSEEIEGQVLDKARIEVFSRQLDTTQDDFFYLYEQLKDTYVHEFGHHVGFTKYHTNYVYDDFIKIRGKQYQTNISLMWYQPTWRNTLFEQFAETYAEIYLGTDYINKSAVPNLTDEQRKEFIKVLRQKVNKGK